MNRLYEKIHKAAGNQWTDQIQLKYTGKSLIKDHKNGGVYEARVF
jgi:hypothetical protein